MDNKKEKKEITIFGVSIWKIFLYFIIYSVLGYIIETLFGLVTKGVIESRKSFLVGPFCGIYGLGAVVMILALKNMKQNNFSLFFGGFLVGSVVEYLVSWVGEMFFHVMWWDYSNIPFNINGRICVQYSFFWGLLAIFLMTYCNPKVDRFIAWLEEKVKAAYRKPIILTIVIALFVDCVVTGFALKMFFTRLVDVYHFNIANTDQYIGTYTKMYEQPKMKKFVDRYFSNEVMLKTFPNLKVEKEDGKILYVADAFPEIQTEYVKLFTPKALDSANILENIRKNQN